jgi:hypothetical protein
MIKKIVLCLSLLIVALFLFGCSEELSDEELDAALEELSDEELDVALEEDTALAGQAYPRFSSKRATKVRIARSSASRVNWIECSEDDGGNSPHQAGEVTYTYSYQGKEKTKTKNDRCSSSNEKLYEYYCKSQTKYGRMTYTCTNGCEDGACKVNEICTDGKDNDDDDLVDCADSDCSEDENCEPQFEIVNDLKYDRINRNIQTSTRFIGDDQEVLPGDYYFACLDLPDTDFSTCMGGRYFDTSYTEENGRGHSFLISDEEASEILIHYPGGNVPYTFTLKFDDWDHPRESEAITFFQTNGNLKIEPLHDNQELKIGVVQVIPPGFKFEDQKLCFLKDTLSDTGYISRGVKSNCRAGGYDTPYMRERMLERSYDFNEIFFSDNPYTVIDNISGPVGDSSSSVKIYSLKYFGKFWEDLLAKHDIVDVETRLKKNPRFDVNFIDPIERETNFDFSGYPGSFYVHSVIRKFFRGVVEEEGLDLEPYDIVYYLMYQPEYPGDGSWGGFAGGGFWAPINLYHPKINFNSAFDTLAHEAGHDLFQGNDLYDSFAIKYPIGLPDPNITHLPLRKACIMAKKFGYTQYEGSPIVHGYETYDYSTSEPDSDRDALLAKLTEMGLDRFHTEDPANYVLCVDTIVEIMGGVENPNCPVEDFYAGNCGDCTSENYLSCTIT